ncbi:MAG TPA: MFS transporter [Candidatus Baltobacteraceae bacterium]|nr:MFS transporter [Candidatus Baltobacteraceae bacterium]
MSADTIASTGHARSRSPEPEPTSAAGPRLLQPLREHDFRLLWLGESVSSLGDQFQFVALAWLVLGLTGSGLALGGVLAVASIPRAALMLVGGAASDRLSPRTILLLSNGTRAIFVGLLAVLVLTGSIQMVEVYVLAIVFGISDAFFYPAIGAIMPQLLQDQARLPSANALFRGTLLLMALVGPPVAGLVVAVAQPGPAFAVNALSFVVAAVALVLIRWRMPVVQASAGTPVAAESVLASIRAGIAYAWHDVTLRLLLVMVAAIDFAFAGPDAVGLAWLSANRWGAGPIGYGVLTGGFALGALAGTLIAGSMPQPRHRSWILTGVAFALGVGLILLGLAPSVGVALLVTVPMGLAGGLINVLLISWLQARTEAAMLGRVMSLVMLASVGLAPISLAAAGLLVDGAVVPLFVGAGGIVLAAAAFGVVSGAAHRLD